MTEEEIVKKAQRSWCNNCASYDYFDEAYFEGYIAGAKEMQEENEQLKKQVLYLKDNLRVARKKLFDILTDYEIGNYDNNIHKFYEDVYDVHNELIRVEE